MNNNHLKHGLLGLAALMLILNGCKKDDDDNPAPTTPVNEEEVITSLYLALVPMGGGDTAIFSFVDLDGDGGNAPVITPDTLVAGTTYSGSLLLLNESTTPADTISNEVAAEAEEHQFFFSTTGGSLSWDSYSDTDADGNPIGLVSQWSTNAAGSGTVQVVLRHLPDKFGANVSAGDITNARPPRAASVVAPRRPTRSIARRGTTVSWKSGSSWAGVPSVGFLVGSGNAPQCCHCSCADRVSPGEVCHAASIATVPGSYCAAPAMWIGGSSMGTTSPMSLVTRMS